MYQENNNYRINDQLKNVNIRLVGDNVTPGIYTYDQAIKLADSLNLDLVEITKNNNESICKIIDYQKFLYQIKRKEQDNKKHQTKIEVKEIRLTPNIDVHDFDVKMRHIEKFLQEGNKVKVSMFFSGREINYSEKGISLLETIKLKLACISSVESDIKTDGKRTTMVLIPKKK